MLLSYENQKLNLHSPDSCTPGNVQPIYTLLLMMPTPTDRPRRVISMSSFQRPSQDTKFQESKCCYRNTKQHPSHRNKYPGSISISGQGKSDDDEVIILLC